MPLEHCKQLLFLTMLLRQHNEVELTSGPIEKMTASTLPSTISPPNCWSPPKGPDFNFVIVLDSLDFFSLDNIS